MASRKKALIECSERRREPRTATYFAEASSELRPLGGRGGTANSRFGYYSAYLRLPSRRTLFRRNARPRNRRLRPFKLFTWSVAETNPSGWSRTHF